MKSAFLILLLLCAATASANALDIKIYSNGNGTPLGWYKIYSCTHSGCEFKGESGPVDYSERLQRIEKDIRIHRDDWEVQRFEHGTVYAPRLPE